MTKEATTKKAAKSKTPILDKLREEKGHNGPCDGKNRCQGMRAALVADTGKTGMHVSVLFNSKTMAMRAVVTYSLGAKQNLMVNYCPWCGTKLAKDAPIVPDAPAAAGS